MNTCIKSCEQWYRRDALAGASAMWHPLIGHRALIVHNTNALHAQRTRVVAADSARGPRPKPGRVAPIAASGQWKRLITIDQ
ncbi:hypothetical protein ACLOJK_021752 [Asimina triloba]